jgi:hypothetical protein
VKQTSICRVTLIICIVMVFTTVRAKCRSLHSDGCSTLPGLAVGPDVVGHWTMKRWFSFQRDKKPGPIVPPPSASPANHSPVPTKKLATLAKERPKSTAPAKPLPSEIWHELTVLATESGLLVRPVLPEATMQLRISWGRDGEVAQVKATKQDEHDWSTGVTVYGLVGILSLFSGTVAPEAETGSLIVLQPRIYWLSVLLQT